MASVHGKRTMNPRILFFLAGLGLMDLACYMLFPDFSWKETWFALIYWLLASIVYVVLVISSIRFQDFIQSGYKVPFLSAGIILTLTAPKLLLLITLLLDQVISWPLYYVLPSYPHLFALLGLGSAVLLVFGFTYGILFGRFRFKVHDKQIPFENLPGSFDGFRIVQISDMHIGSFFGDNRPLERAVELINQLKADLVLFTGDMVNNHAGELAGHEETLSKIQASEGKFAVLGNHDYGDYLSWSSAEQKEDNLNELKDRIRKAGFSLLLNESVTITRSNENIDLVGVENWGLPPFKQYGKLDKALEMSGATFKVLMSHDPSHWDAEVQQSDIDLTLSGHTHGMQFGFELGKWKWSPVKYKYRKWAGLYENKGKFLYVNRGLGYIGYPGRLGIWPEITLITLRAQHG